jgi:hypothetical protein
VVDYSPFTKAAFVTPMFVFVIGKGIKRKLLQGTDFEFAGGSSKQL